MFVTNKMSLLPKKTTTNECVGIGGNASQVIDTKSVILGYSNLPRGIQNGPHSINIGHDINRSLGQSSITIGAHCGTGAEQVPNNCIVLSAAGKETQIIPSSTGSCHITPVRSATGPYSLYYNSSNSELTYGNFGSLTQTLNSPGPIDVSGVYNTTNIMTAGTFTMATGTNLQQKSIYNTYNTVGVWGPALGSGISASSNVNAIAIDYTRNMMYIAGDFNAVNGVPNGYIARYNLSTNEWGSPMGSGLNAPAYSLIIDTKRDILYIGGVFTTGGGVSGSCLIKYDLKANQWLSMNGPDGSVLAMVIDTARDMLYIGGSFVKANNIIYNHIARYNLATNQWSATFAGGTNLAVRALALDTTRDHLYVGGEFTYVNNILTNYVTRYELTNGLWLGLVGNGTDSYVQAFAIDTLRDVLYMGGTFINANRIVVNSIASYNLKTNTWGALGQGVNSSVFCLCIDSTYSTLYVGGTFVYANNVSSKRITRYDLTKSEWSVFYTGVNGWVYALADDSSRKVMYVGGSFSAANDTVPNSGIARYDYNDSMITGPFWYNYTPYTSLNIGINGSINCIYNSNLAAWVITSQTDISTLNANTTIQTKR